MISAEEKRNHLYFLRRNSYLLKFSCMLCFFYFLSIFLLVSLQFLTLAVTETVAVMERQVGKMEVAELKTLRWALGVTRKNKIKNESVRRTAKIAMLGDKLRNARLRWYVHVKRREEDNVEKRMMKMAVSGKRKRRRPRRRWIDLTTEDMERVGAKEGDEVDRDKRKILSRCGDLE